MHAQHIVKVSEQTGLSFVDVSHDDMWELVEQLSNQRAAVNYTYQADYFTVSFLNLDVAAVQRLLDDWNPNERSGEKECPEETYAMAAMTR
jgi:hypothetical protein